MNIVFLDVDGVLVYNDYENLSTFDIDIEKVKLLKEICDKTNSSVVISSSWREYHGNHSSCYTILRNILNANGIDVIDDTPYIEPKLEDLIYFKVKHGTGRAAEIQKWIKDNSPDNFVILDDEDFDWKDYGYDNHWVRPTWFGDGGLQREHVDKAIEILSMK